MTATDKGYVSKYVWSETNINSSMMGKYLTAREWWFVQQGLSRFRKPLRVLDVGGGDGRFARRLAELGVHTIVLERDDQPLKELLLQDWNKPVLQADGNDLPFPDNTFDAVMVIENPACTDTMHLHNFLYSAHRILKPAGRLMFTSYNTISIIGLLKFFSPDRNDCEDGNTYTESYRKTMHSLQQHGFAVHRAFGFRWIPFNRKSKSKLIPLFERLERIFHLDRLAGISPWIFWVAEKRENKVPSQ